MDDLWNTFFETGKIEDYLNYKNQNGILRDENENEGPDNKRTDSRGE